MVEEATDGPSLREPLPSFLHCSLEEYASLARIFWLRIFRQVRWKIWTTRLHGFHELILQRGLLIRVIRGRIFREPGVSCPGACPELVERVSFVVPPLSFAPLRFLPLSARSCIFHRRCKSPADCPSPRPSRPKPRSANLFILHPSAFIPFPTAAAPPPSDQRNKFGPRAIEFHPEVELGSGHHLTDRVIGLERIGIHHERKVILTLVDYVQSPPGRSCYPEKSTPELLFSVFRALHVGYRLWRCRLGLRAPLLPHCTICGFDAPTVMQCIHQYGSCSRSQGLPQFCKQGKI